MTTTEANVALSAILTTALETGAAVPESMGYLALGSDMRKWETIRTILVSGGLMSVAGNALTLTAKGTDVARKCAAYAASRK